MGVIENTVYVGILLLIDVRVCKPNPILLKNKSDNNNNNNNKNNNNDNNYNNFHLFLQSRFFYRNFVADFLTSSTFVLKSINTTGA